MAKTHLNNDLKKQKYMTQKEMAKHFRKTEGTIINWRRKGHFTYFRAPGSNSVLYLRENVEDFEKKNTEPSNKKEVDNKPKPVKREKPVVSTTKEWRI
jgi:hypothetical protein